MSQLNGEHPSTNNGTRTTLVVFVVAIIAVIILFMLYSHLPHADVSKGLLSDFTTPIATPNDLVGSINVNRSITLSGLQLTVTKVQQAASFSDAKRHSGRYTVRIYVQTHNPGLQPAAVDFINRMRLLLPNGQTIAPLVLSVSPLTMPEATQVGFIDFPVQDKVELGSVMLRFDTNTTIPFTAK